MDITSKAEENEVKELSTTSETVFRNEVHNTAFSFKATIDESFGKENPRNPMLLSPVIRCVLKFLNIEDIKNCRLVSQEWGSTGKIALANRTLICFHKNDDKSFRLPVDFYSCFLESTVLFSAFKISGNVTEEDLSKSWTTEELAKFFEERQNYIKELTLDLKCSEENIGKNIDINSWISKSPMVQKNTKQTTKLSIEVYGKELKIPPLHLIAHVKDLTLSNCRIDLEGGIQFCAIKLKLNNSIFFKDGIELDQVLINDIVDLRTAKEVSLSCRDTSTKYVLDLRGNTTLDKLILKYCEILNGESSQWVIKHLEMDSILYSLHSQMQVKELSLTGTGNVDLFTLPDSTEKLILRGTPISCSQPTVLENLQCLKVYSSSDYSILSHFVNCPQLTYLKLTGDRHGRTMNSLWMPKNVKILTIVRYLNWVSDSYVVNLEKLFFINSGVLSYVKDLCKAKIRVDDLIVLQWNRRVDKTLIDFLEYRNHFNFGKRLYLGQLLHGKEELKKFIAKEHLDDQSAFYVFDNGEKGRAISGNEFYAVIPNYGI